MKSNNYFLFFVFLSLLGCSENPSDSNKNSILSDSKTITNNFVFHRDSIFNMDTLTITLETSTPDVYLFTKFYLAQRYINSYGYTLLQSDSAITSVNFVVRPDYTEILWSTSYELNNMGWEIQRKDSNETYSAVGFVNGSGTSNETHSYYFKHNIEPSKIFYYRFKQIHFDGSSEYALESKIEVEAIDSIKVEFSITADNGVIKYDGDIAPESGYSSNIPINPNELIYFRNSQLHYGKIRIHSFNFLNDPYLKIDESYKNISYNLSYEIFLQTNGERTFF